MQRGFELLAVRLAQRAVFSRIDHPVQFFHIHIETGAGRSSFFYSLSNSRKRRVSASPNTSLMERFGT